MKKIIYSLVFVAAIGACTTAKTTTTTTTVEPVKPALNIPTLPALNQPIDFAAITPNDIIVGADATKEKVNAMLAAYIAIPNNQRTFENTIVALDDIDNEINAINGIVGIMSNASPDSAIRATAQAKDVEISEIYTELYLNEDLYKAVKAYSELPEAKALTGWKAKIVEDLVRDFEMNGFALSKEKRDELKTLMNELSEIQSTFAINIAKYQDFLYLEEKDMEGLSEDYKKARLQPDGKYKIGMSYPDTGPFFRNAKSSSARKDLLFKYNNRAADTNNEVLRQMIAKRTEIANLLGFETYAEYALVSKMATKPEVVWDFLNALQEKVKPKGESDIQELLAYQKEIGLGDGVTIQPWDRGYVRDQLLINKYNVDVEMVRPYFPMDQVKKGLFTITQTLFNLEYKKVENASVWHEDVEAYDVYDGSKLIGRFYLDLFPRENKYTHAACFPIVIGRNTPTAFQRPTSALICNFTPPTEDKPSLLTHDEVETFFHEFGHVLHSLLTEAELGGQSGFMVARDFVEAPSQIFENWVWNYDALSMFAKHYETGEVIPKALFDKMDAAKNVMSGRNALGQIFLSVLDMTLYDGFDLNGPETIAEMRAKLDEKINLLPPMEGTHFEASFGHLSGYGAGYYGYLWSNVFAQDMFSRFEKEGILNKKTGMDYRKIILAQGATKDEMQMIEEFLGRPTNQDAFLRSIGLEVE
jgi:thimet oligopeptidase